MNLVFFLLDFKVIKNKRWKYQFIISVLISFFLENRRLYFWYTEGEIWQKMLSLNILSRVTCNGEFRWRSKGKKFTQYNRNVRARHSLPRRLVSSCSGPDRQSCRRFLQGCSCMHPSVSVRQWFTIDQWISEDYCQVKHVKQDESFATNTNTDVKWDYMKV